MKVKTSLFLTVLLIFICCIGAASAAEDISDDAISTDSDLEVIEQTDDATLEVNNEEGTVLSGTPQSVSSWTDIKTYSEKTDADYEITVANGTYNVGSDQVIFGNNAKIIGSGNTVITGGSSSVIPFYAEGKSITFSNLIFRNMNSDMVIQLVDSGSSKIENCIFENLLTGTSGQKSVVYNNGGYMQVINTNFTNCNTTFGVITNHKTATSTFMDVENCKFEYNNANSEPGAINNCGIMNITACVFNYNNAGLWAGAVHTHTNAKSVIKRSSFTGNTAGYNGGALYTYADLEVYDSNFTNNNCTTNAGGGAIGASNYFFASKAYNVTINNCRFVDNNNINSAGYGGAITGMNGGTLFVNGSTFIHNSAKTGQAISAYNTKQYANISEGQSHLVITNNKFINHTGSATTVYLTGTYIFENNKFINSPQVPYTGSGNTYNSDSSSSKKSENILKASYQENIADVQYITSNDEFNSKLEELWYSGGDIYLSEATWSCNLDNLGYLENEINIIGKNRENTIVSSIVLERQYKLMIDWGMPDTVENGLGTINWINVTFNSPIVLSGTNCKFINCTFNSTVSLEKYLEDHIDVDAYESEGYSANLFDYTFENCDFVNYTADSVILGYQFANITISDCTFNNIVADNIIQTSCGKGIVLDASGADTISVIVQAKLILKDSTFKNTDVNSIIKAKTASVEYITVENNQYEFIKSQSTSDSDYTYIDVPVVVDSKITIANESDIVIITVTADGKAIIGATVNYTIGDDKRSNVTDVNGQIKISGLTDEFEIVANYYGNQYINSNSSSQKFNFTKATSDANGTSTNSTGNATSGNGTSTNSTGNATSGNGTSTNSTGNATSGNGTSTNTDKTNTNTNKQTTKVTKKATKITAKKATFKAKKKTKKYTITLKAGKKAIKKVKVTLKVGKKTYKATTNSKGKATFKITKLNKKGKYTAVIKFAGNKNYKATSKKVRITVKK